MKKVTKKEFGIREVVAVIIPNHVIGKHQELVCVRNYKKFIDTVQRSPRML